MISVLHLIPTLEGGGAERQLALLAIEQARRGMDVHVGVRRGGVHSREMTENGVHLHVLGDFGGFDYRLFLTICRLIRSIRPGIIQTWLLQMDIVGGCAALLTRCRWIITERTSAKQYVTIPVQSWVRLQLGRLASAVVVNSQAGRDLWTQSLRRSPEIFLIRNAIDVARIRASVPKELPGAVGGRQLLLVVGRFSPEKALEVVVQAIAHIPRDRPLAVLIIGEGPLRESIHKQIEENAQSDRILMMPYQPDWWGWLRKADALVSISRHEGNPNVVLEAMAGGCPLIVSNIPAHREILDATSATLVPPDDANELAKAIIELLSNAPEAQQRAAHALERVSALTVQSTADAHDRVYRYAMNERA